MCQFDSLAMFRDSHSMILYVVYKLIGGGGGNPIARAFMYMYVCLFVCL